MGKNCIFEYDDVSGNIKILDYKKSKPQGYVTLQYNDIIVTTTTPNLLHLKIPRLFHKEKTKHEDINMKLEILLKNIMIQ